MSEQKKIRGMWKLQPIEEMTREELMDALEELGEAYNSELRRSAEDMSWLISLNDRR